MREARFIIPVNGTLSPVVQAALHNIRTMFGGATTYGGGGHWRSPANIWIEEPVHIIDVAYPQSYENDCKLFAMAHEYRKASMETEVYLRYGNGHVQFVSKDSIAMDNGESMPTEDIDVPEFINLLDAANRLTDEHSNPGERVAALEYAIRQLTKGSIGNHRKKVFANGALGGHGADWGAGIGEAKL